MRGPIIFLFVGSRLSIGIRLFSLSSMIRLLQRRGFGLCLPRGPWFGHWRRACFHSFAVKYYTVCGRCHSNHSRLLIDRSCIHTHACMGWSWPGKNGVGSASNACSERHTHTPRYSMQCREGVKSVGLLLPSNDSINKRDRSERRLTSRPLKLLGQQCRLCSAGSEPGSGLWLLLLYVFVVWD
jgi:hypothetical protein